MPSSAFMRKPHITILIVFIHLFFQVNAQKKEYSFKHTTTNNGLSNSYVTDIVQDSDGFMWFGTQDGLNKYDGNKFIIYRNDPQNPKSISHNFIRKLFIDHKGNLWVGSEGGGLSLFQKETNTFINYQNSLIDSNSISHNTVMGIVEDAKGNLWVATSGGGLNYLDTKTGKFSHFRHNAADSQSISSNVIWDVLIDKKNNLWIATRDNGLDRMVNPNSFVHYSVNTLDPGSISSNILTCLFEDLKGNIWIGTEAGGLNLYHPEKNNFSHYKTNENIPGSIYNNDILSIEQDIKENLWIGTENGGISILKKGQKTFITLKVEERNNHSINNNSIHSLQSDNKGNMWVGTYSGGINFLSAEPEKFIHYKNDGYNPNSLNNNNVLSIFLIDTITSLIGTDGGGLNIFNLSTGHFKHFVHTKNNNSISSNYVLSVFQDRDKDIWIGSYKGGLSLFNKEKGTFYNFKVDETGVGSIDPSIGKIIQDKEGYLWIANYGKGISRYDKKNKQFKHYVANSNISGSISHGVVFTLLEDSKGNIWAGTEGGGLNLFDKTSQSFAIFKHVFRDEKSLSNDIVNAIFEDSKGNLWVGTNNGLNLFDIKTKSFTSFFEKDGLPNDAVLSIIEDDKSNLWISTNKGLSKYNLNTLKFKNYTLADGLQGNSFNRNAAFKDKAGRIFFGGLNGFNVFYPDSIFEDPDFPPTFITDFKLFNKSIVVGDKDSILKKNLRYTQTITLDYAQSFFSFDFIALNYSQPERNQYAYKLEGFNDDWVYVGAGKSATYTNLNPGKYVFKVKASNNEGDWGTNEASIQVIITPPFWLTWWFKLLSILSACITVIVIFSIRTRNIRKKNKWLSEEVKVRTHEINDQKEEILAQKNDIEEKNLQLSMVYKDIQDSLHYAKTIQEAMLQNIASAKQYLDDLFILLKPRDVVSGDFYWYTKKNDKIIIAAVDCTGHGVPGALLSMVGNDVLNQIVNVNGITEPDKILFELNSGIRSALKQDETGSRDGMDVALCVIDKGAKTLEYSGAFNPLYLIQNNELQVVKANSISIGGGRKKEEVVFIKHTFDISVPTTLYIASDGYQDQIGGAGNMKFMKKMFRELLLEIHHHPMEKQREILDHTIEGWMANQHQRDDILVIGVRI